MNSFILSVVTFNNEDIIQELLTDITGAKEYCKSNGWTLDVRIYDNKSTDGTAEAVKKLGFGACLVRSDENVGFGAGHNRNVLGVNGDVIIICNPDIRFQPEILKEVKSRFERDRHLGMLLPRLYYPDGNEQHLCKRNPTLADIYLRRFAPGFIRKVFRRRMAWYVMEDKDYNHEFPVEYGSGSFMIIRADAYRAARGFDERYFMYIEDADITREIREVGYECLYTPSIQVVHHYSKGSYKSIRLAWVNIVSVVKYVIKWSILKKVRKGRTPK